jgi:hypothetical protein
MADSKGFQKVQVVALKISFLMPHQKVLSDLKELATQLYPEGTDEKVIDRSSPEYLLGAYEALTALITDLEKKGY